MVHIEYNVEECIGCGACSASCPYNWEMDGDKAKCLNYDPEQVGCNKEAEDVCPVDCIKVIE